MKALKLFMLICLISGLLIVGFSVIGNGLIKPNGIFIGAIVGGLTGIVIVSLISVYLSLINKRSLGFVIVFSIAGFALAVFISFYNLDSPVVLVMSASLIGLGALLGDYVKNARKNP